MHEDGQPIGRIRYTKERSPGLWLRTVTVNFPDPPFGDAKTIDEAKAQFKNKHGPEKLTKVYGTYLAVRKTNSLVAEAVGSV